MSSDLIGELGSLNDYAERRGLDPAAGEALTQYGAALGGLRRIIADFEGVSLDHLHQAALRDPEASVGWSGPMVETYEHAREAVAEL